MPYKNILLVVSSAALCAASFLCMSFLWWLSFVFLVPLFLLSLHKYSFWYGCFWGVIFYTLHSCTLWHVCRSHAVVWWWLVIPFVMIGWFCIWSGVWFYFFYKTNNFFLKVFVTALFFLGMHHIVLTPFSWRLEGYPFVSPLMPLFYGNGLAVLSYVPLVIVYIFFILCAACVAYKRWLCAFFCFACVGFPRILRKSTYDFTHFMCIKLPQSLSVTAYERAQEIGIALDTAYYQFPEKKVFVLPESVFPYALNDHTYMMHFLSIVPEDVFIFLGGYRYESNNIFNTAFLIQQGRIIQHYDKRFLVNFFECHHPFLCNQKRFKEITAPFLKQKMACTANKHQKAEVLNIVESLEKKESQAYVPLICSEAFWYMPHHKKVIALVNDRYFYAYFAAILYTVAAFNAYKNNTKLFYCGYQVNSNTS